MLWSDLAGTLGDVHLGVEALDIALDGKTLKISFRRV